MRVETFSTDSLPYQGRLRVWQETMGRLGEADFGTEPLGTKPFNASVTSYFGPRLRFSEYRFSPHITTYRPHGRAAQTRRHFILAYLKEGDAIVAQDGRQTSVVAGDIVLVDPLRPLRIEANAMRVNSVNVCAEQMKTVVPQVDGLTSIALKSDYGPGAILRSMLDELFRVGANLDDGMSNRIADAVPHVVAAALASLPAAGQAVPSRLEAYHRERIREVIRSNLRDPNLGPRSVARAVGLSPRHVHQLFGDKSMTLMRWIWVQRLTHCREELAMASLRHRTIGEIAYGWGFSNQAHFSRAFRAHFGQSPRTFRQQSL